MVFAAGFGKRMRPLSLRRAKPLIEVGGRSMLDRALDALEHADFELAVVNTHYLATQVHEAVWARRRAGRGPRVILSHESEILETGGGLMRALGLLGDQPFVSLNADVVLLDRGDPALLRLGEAFEPDRMDALLLLQPRHTAVGYAGEGDFSLASDGMLERADETPRPYAFTGVQVWHPRAFARAPRTPFSLSALYWERRRRHEARLPGLYGLVHQGEWLHVGSPEDLTAAERYLETVAPDRAP
jgi:MurNAc alpha-1-phosphate uridylyltransferase